MAGETTTTQLTNVIQTYIERTVYNLLAYNVVFDSHARLFPLPSGHTLRVPTVMPHAVIKGNLPEVVTSSSVSSASLKPQYTERSVDFFGAFTDITKKAAKASLIDAVRIARGQLEQQAARSINRRFAYNISSARGMRWRRVALNSANDQLLNNVTGTVTSSSAFKRSTKIDYDKDPYGGAQIFFTTGKNAGQGRMVKSATTATSHFTMQSAFDQAPTAGDLFDLVSPSTISSTTTYAMTLGDVFVMAELARRAGAQGFVPGGKVREDGFGIMRNTAGTVPQLVLFVDTMVALDIQADAATNGYTDVFKQTEGGLSRWSKGQFGLVNNVSFIMHNEGWRMTASSTSAGGGAESDTGVVHTPTLVGMDSYYATKFRGVGNDSNGLAFRVKTPGSSTFSVRHDSIISRIEWDAWLAAGTQNGFHGVVMLCSAYRAA
jgi:hypothetical protein